MEQNTRLEQSLNKKEEQEIDLIALSKMLVRNWKWYLIALPACLVLGVLYLQSTPKQYERKASVLIKDEKGGSPTMGGLAELSDLASFGIKSSVDNELLIFQSNTLITEVVKRLNLNLIFKVSQGLRKEDLYGQTPLVIDFLEGNYNQPIEMQAKIGKDGVNFNKVATWSEGEKVKLADFSVALNDTVDTPLGLLVVRLTGLGENFIDDNIYINRAGLKETAINYEQKIQISLVNKTSTIINIALRDESAQRAEDVINTLIDIYNEDAINDKNRMALNTDEFINERLIIIEKELGGVDSQIERFKQSERLTDISSDAAMFMTETTGLKKEELAIINQRSLAEFIKSYLQDPSNRGKLIPANTGISDNNTESQIQEYNKQLLQRDRLLSNSSDKNPVVRDLNKSLFAMEQNINRSVDNVIAGLDLQLENIRSRDKQTLKRIEAVPSQEKYVLTVGRQQKIKEALYLFLLNKREENALAQAITQSNARVIDSARGGDAPVAPRSMMILAGCLFLGVLVPTGLLLLISFSDNKVRNRLDIEDLNIPFLGDIPESINKDKDSDVVVRENARDHVSESFRIIRTNLAFMEQQQKQQVITLTSLTPDSGKSFVIINLAVVLAISKKRVIVIDLDIRKRQLSERLGIDQATGISHYLSGQETDIKKLILPSSENENLFYISAGITPPNPAELLMSYRLEELTAELRKEFDYILFDNVPSMVVADAAITNRVVDMTIYVMRAGLVDKRDLEVIEKIYGSGKFRNLCLILNGVKVNKQSISGNYGYGYGYGYGDGYTD